MSVSMKPYLVSELNQILFQRFLEDGMNESTLAYFATSGKRPLSAFAQATWRHINGCCMQRKFTCTFTTSVCIALSAHFLRQLKTDATILDLSKEIRDSLFGNKWITNLTLFGRFRTTTEIRNVIQHWPHISHLSCDLSVFLRLSGETEICLPELCKLEIVGQRKLFTFPLSRRSRIPFPETLVLRLIYKLKSFLDKLFAPIIQFPGVKHLELHVSQRSLFTAADLDAIEALSAMFPNLKSVHINISMTEIILKDFAEMIPLLNAFAKRVPRQNIQSSLKVVGRASPASQNYAEIFENRGFLVTRPGSCLTAKSSHNRNYTLNMQFFFNN